MRFCEKHVKIRQNATHGELINKDIEKNIQGNSSLLFNIDLSIWIEKIDLTSLQDDSSARKTPPD